MPLAHTPAVIGLDLSIRATGIADIAGAAWTVKPHQLGDERLNHIRDNVQSAVMDGCDLVVIEDLPTNAKAAGVTGMVHGVIRAALLTWGVRYVLVTPATIKKYATGNGSCGKPEMAVAAYKRLGAEFMDDNACDAWWLRAMGMHALGAPLFDLPARQVQALDAVAWPAGVRA